jgi:hypothetical protein
MPRTLVITLGGLVVVGGILLVLLRSPEETPRSAEPIAEVTRPAATPVPAPRPAAPTEAPRPSPRPRPAPAPTPAAEAEPAPVEAAPEDSTLYIESDVPGAQVFIDREFIGATPVTVPNVKPGSHRLNVSAQGYEGIADTIEVEPGKRDILIKFKEVRLNVAMDVVHKHRLGSCRGRLIATPGGLRYETTDKDDVFSAPLLDLETFEIDYLDKNLRIVPRKGKRYDFTDPKGDADRLFVFHRDVEKARDRLKKGDPPASD